MENQYNKNSANKKLSAASHAEKYEPAQRRSFYFTSKPPELPTIDPKDVDKLLAQELNQLSFEDRDLLFQELHGVTQDCTIKETPDMIENSIRNMTIELSKQQQNKKDDNLQNSFVIAMEHSPAYINSLKLPFLRAEEFRVKDAASRLLAFLDAIQALFGNEVLGRPVTLRDFHDDPESIMALECGFVQLLPSRDRAGRAVVFLRPGYRATLNLRYTFRCMVYLLQSAMEDEETQKNGVVIINYNLGDRVLLDRHLVWHGSSMLSSMPVRLVCTHYCYNHEPSFLSWIKLLVGKNGRKRLRVHRGSDLECQYELVTFGIPQCCIPVTPNGELLREHHYEWLQQRRQREEQLRQRQDQRQRNETPAAGLNSNTATGTDINAGEGDDNKVHFVIVPNRDDVLLGRGKNIIEHAGNLKLHFLIDEFAEEYEKAGKAQKTEIAKLIVSRINGRFLKKDLDGWMQVDEQVARNKVSHAFRTRRRRPIQPIPSPPPSSVPPAGGTRNSNLDDIDMNPIDLNDNSDENEERGKRLKLWDFLS